MATSRRTATNENVNTFGGANRDYTSMATWESDTDIDLVGGAQSEVLECYADAASYNVIVLLAGATTNASYFRIIRAADNAKHNGTVNTGCFQILTTTAGFPIRLSEDFAQVQDLVVSMSFSSASSFKGIETAKPYDGTKVIGCIAHACVNTGSGAVSAAIEADGDDAIAVNCLAYDNELVGIEVNIDAGKTARIYNCTSIDNGALGFNNFGAGTAIIKNSLAEGNATGDFQTVPSWDTGTEYNASGDGSAPGTNSRINQTFTFRDVGNDDFHLAPNDGGARDFGTDLSADSDFPFDDSITPLNGTTFTPRPQPSGGSWDIGAFEYRAGPALVRAGGATGTSLTIDIGDAGNNRLIAIFAGDESDGTSLTGVTVDGKTATKVTEADNPSGLGNHLELWYIDEDGLGASAGSVTIAITGGDAGWAIHAQVFYGVDQDGEFDAEIEEAVASAADIDVENVTVPAGGIVVMGAGQGSSGQADNWTSPLIEVTDGPGPSSAVLATAAAIETSLQTNKTYSCTMSVTFNRGTGIVASWAPFILTTTSTTTVTTTTVVTTTTEQFLLAGTADLQTTTPDAILTVLQELAGTADLQTTTPDALLTVLRELAGAADLVTTTPDALLTVLRELTGTADLVTTTPDALLSLLMELSGTADLQTTTPDAQISTLIELAGTAALQTTTPDAILTLLIELSGTSALVTTTPDAALSLLMELSGTAALVTTTPDAQVSLILELAGTAAMQTTTPDALLTVLRELIGTADLVTTTPDAYLSLLVELSGTAALVTTTPDAQISTLIELLGTADLVTTTPDALLTVLRELTGTADLVTSTPDAALTTAIILAGTAAMQTTTPAALMEVLRELIGTAGLQTTTPDALLTVLRELLGTADLVTDTPDAQLLTALELSGTAGLQTTTPDALLTLLMELAGTADLVTDTPDAILCLRYLLSGTADLVTDTLDALLFVLRELSGTADLVTITPDAFIKLVEIAVIDPDLTSKTKIRSLCHLTKKRTITSL